VYAVPCLSLTGDSADGIDSQRSSISTWHRTMPAKQSGAARRQTSGRLGQVGWGMGNPKSEREAGAPAHDPHRRSPAFLPATQTGSTASLCAPCHQGAPRPNGQRNRYFASPSSEGRPRAAEGAGFITAVIRYEPGSKYRRIQRLGRERRRNQAKREDGQQVVVDKASSKQRLTIVHRLVEARFEASA